MKSGTNQYHGTVYDYFVNEALNAAQPLTNDGSGHLIRQRNRRNDYGFTLRGPVSIPKLYNGHDKTFFFLNFEQVRGADIVSTVPLTRQDPVALKIQALMPLPQSSATVNNLLPIFPADRRTSIPSLKLDHQFSPNDKLSFLLVYDPNR
jgi:hypothetical protein